MKEKIMSYVELIESAREEKRVCGSPINQVECARVAVDYWKHRAMIAENDADRLSVCLQDEGLSLHTSKMAINMHKEALEARK
jgi:hypothetical protein